MDRKTYQTLKKVVNFKKAIIHLLLSGFIFLNSCSEDEKPKPDQELLNKINISSHNLFSVLENGFPIDLIISGEDSDGDAISNFEYEVFVNGSSIGQQTSFIPQVAGIITIQAISNNIVSNVLTVEVRNEVQYPEKEFTIIFHIVHDGEAMGSGYNINYNRIQYQMSLLESSFKNNHLTANSSFPNFKFKLATQDPEGNVLTEPGVNRIQRPSINESILFENWMWDYYWDPDDFINVWIGDTKNGYSWGIYPNVNCDIPIIPEGIYCLNTNDLIEVPYITGIALELNNLWDGNMVFPHEMGHLFGLFHIFNGDGCTNDADYCKDTFQYNRQNYESNQTGIYRTSCEFNHQFTSYNTMDYWSQPAVNRDFTYDQIKRMQIIAESGLFVGNKLFSQNTLPNSVNFDEIENKNNIRAKMIN